MKQRTDLTDFAQYYPFLLDLVTQGKYDPSFVFTNVGKSAGFAFARGVRTDALTSVSIPRRFRERPGRVRIAIQPRGARRLEVHYGHSVRPSIGSAFVSSV
jgi:hypothetical protein